MAEATWLTCSPNVPTWRAAATTESRPLPLRRRFLPFRRLITAMPPASPAAADAPVIRGTFARETASETAFPAARVPSAAALLASAAFAAASTGLGAFLAAFLAVLAAVFLAALFFAADFFAEPFFADEAF